MPQQEERLEIQGMSCGHCVRAVREALEETQGVTVEGVDIGTATVRYESGQNKREEIRAALAEAGYEVID